MTTLGSWEFGVAGGACALEAANNGARVLLIGGRVGGGSTQRSSGGGTQPQTDAGFNDNADNMYQCLKVDTEGAVADDRLTACRNEHADAFNWLAEKCIKFVDFIKNRYLQICKYYGRFRLGLFCQKQ